MYRIKSIFGTVYLAYTLVAGIVQVYEYITTQDPTWLLSSLIHFVPSVYVLLLYKIATPRHPRIEMPVFLIVGLLISTMLIMRDSPAKYSLLLVFGVVTLFGWLLWINWYGKLPKRKETLLNIGDTFPSVTFENINKSPIPSLFFLGEKALFMFYRGNWCPTCRSQIKELSKITSTLKELRTQVILISSQNHIKTEKLSRKYDKSMIFLVDIKGLVAKQLNIYHKGGTPFGLEIFGFGSNTTLPTIVIVNEVGKIIYVNHTDNYRERPDPAYYIDFITNSTLRS